MRSFERSAYVVFLIASIIAVVVAISLVIARHVAASRWLASAGLIATITGLFQLQVSELFEKIIQKYSDDQRYPGGPPSHITRQIIDNPDAPVKTGFRNFLFFSPKTGLWIIVI